MILDSQTVLSGTTTAAGVTTGQAITATAISENVIDLRIAATPALVDEGMNPDETWLIVLVQTAAAGGDAAKTLTITLESDSTANLATAPVVHASTAAITGATLVAGYEAWRIPLPSGNYKRYLGLRYTVSAGFTSFAIRAFIVADAQRNYILPGSFTVL
jgi:hypothetical protein